MADVDESAAALYAEVGASWWPVLWGPVFAVIGLAVEVFTAGPTHVFTWVLLAGVFAVAAAVWVSGRRRLCSVRLTSTALVLGRESLPVSTIAAVTDVGAPAGAPVLGGGWTAPKGTYEVPVLLKDSPQEGPSRAGGVVLAWARDPEALTSALRSLLRND